MFIWYLCVLCVRCVCVLDLPMYVLDVCVCMLVYIKCVCGNV